MELASTISSIAVIILVPWLLQKIFLKPSQEKVESVDGKITLKFPKSFLIIGIVVSLFAIVMWIGVMSQISESNTSGIVTISVISSLFFIMGLFILFASKMYYVIISDEKITSRTLLGKKTEIMWAAVNKVSFGPVSSNLKIKSDNKTIAVDIMLNGFNKFVEILKVKVDPKLCEEAIAKIEEYKKNVKRV